MGDGNCLSSFIGSHSGRHSVVDFGISLTRRGGGGAYVTSVSWLVCFWKTGHTSSASRFSSFSRLTMISAIRVREDSVSSSSILARPSSTTLGAKPTLQTHDVGGAGQFWALQMEPSHAVFA